MCHINKLVGSGPTPKCTKLFLLELRDYLIHHLTIPTYDSRSLDKVEVREIGRRSVLMSLGGCTFGKGTLAC